jgi:hypothetical protein
LVGDGYLVQPNARKSSQNRLTGFVAYRQPRRGRRLDGLDDWLAERFRWHRGNAEVVRQDLARGVGKTHLAIALGRAAIREGYSVLFVTAPALVAALAKAHAENRLEERLGFFAKPKLLIIDELGYLPFETNAAHLFFQLVSRRYERGSLLLTSNRSVGEWGAVFGDPMAGHPRSPATPQRRHYHSWRQLSSARETPHRSHQGDRAAADRGARLRRACPGGSTGTSRASRL